MSLIDKISQAPRLIVNTLVQHGYEAYVVGGAVRDLLLGVEPKDYDIATSASPEEVRAVFGRRKCRIIGRRFRLAHVILQGEIYEVSTFRRKPDENERRGRKEDEGNTIWNDNVFGTMEEDAARRDFTVNALYLDVAGDRGIVDYCGGQKDIKKGVVRALGEPAERLEEDPVRMVRALKLVANFDFKLERKLKSAIKAKKDLLSLASDARMFEELLKVFCSHQILPILDTFREYGLLKYVWPVFDQCWDEREGILTRKILELIDKKKATNDFPPSKALILSCVTLPFLMSALNPSNPSGFWTDNRETEKLARRAVQVVFEKYQVPAVFMDRMIEICFLVPKLVRIPVAKRVENHIEYKYGKLLTQLLFEASGWDMARLEKLPK